MAGINISIEDASAGNKITFVVTKWGAKLDRLIKTWSGPSTGSDTGETYAVDFGRALEVFTLHGVFQTFSQYLDVRHNITSHWWTGRFPKLKIGKGDGPPETFHEVDGMVSRFDVENDVEAGGDANIRFVLEFVRCKGFFM